MGIFESLIGGAIGGGGRNPRRDLDAALQSVGRLQGAANLTAGGLSSTAGPNGIVVGSDWRRTLNTRLMQNALRNEIKSLDLARGQVTPGFGALTKARLAEIESGRTRTVGNLSENLAQRRVLGSSFGQDAIARAQAEYDKQAGEARAKSVLEEFALTQELNQRKYQRARNVYETALGELNLQADFGIKTQQAGIQALGEAARLSAELGGMAAGLTASENAAGGELGSTIGGQLGSFLPF